MLFIFLDSEVPSSMFCGIKVRFATFANIRLGFSHELSQVLRRRLSLGKDTIITVEYRVCFFYIDLELCYSVYSTMSSAKAYINKHNYEMVVAMKVVWMKKSDIGGGSCFIDIWANTLGYQR